MSRQIGPAENRAATQTPSRPPGVGTGRRARRNRSTTAGAIWLSRVVRTPRRPARQRTSLFGVVPRQDLIEDNGVEYCGANSPHRESAELEGKATGTGGKGCHPIM